MSIGGTFSSGPLRCKERPVFVPTSRFLMLGTNVRLGPSYGNIVEYYQEESNYTSSGNSCIPSVCLQYTKRGVVMMVKRESDMSCLRHMSRHV